MAVRVGELRRGLAEPPPPSPVPFPRATEPRRAHALGPRVPGWFLSAVALGLAEMEGMEMEMGVGMGKPLAACLSLVAKGQSERCLRASCCTGTPVLRSSVGPDRSSTVLSYQGMQNSSSLRVDRI